MSERLMGFKTLHPRPGEVVVITHPKVVSDEVIEQIHDSAKRLWPDNEIIVLDGGARIGTLDVDDVTKRVDRLEDMALSAHTAIQDRAIASLMDIVQEIADVVGKDEWPSIVRDVLENHRHEFLVGPEIETEVKT